MPTPRRPIATQRNDKLLMQVLAATLIAMGIGAVIILARDAPRAPEQSARTDVDIHTDPAASPTERPTKDKPTEPVTFTWVGDMMLGSTTPTPELAPNGARNMFDSVRSLLVADVVMGNLEGPLTDSGPKDKCADRTDCYMFSQPPAYAEVYKAAGFGVLNLANNHVMDRGAEGIASTKAALEAEGIAYTGLPGNDATIEAKGLTISALGFSHFNGSNSSTNTDAVKARIALAKESADIVIVFVHGGKEGVGGIHVTHDDPGIDLITFAHAAVDAGADAVLGAGPHVLRGIEFYQGKPIAYSLGNFATYGKFNLSKNELRRSAVLEITLASDGTFASGKIKPVRLAGEGTPEPGGEAIAFVQELSGADFGDRAANIADDGAITPPPTSRPRQATVE